MSPTDLVPTLAWCQKLRALRVKQKSYFVWSVPNPSKAKTPQDAEALTEQNAAVYVWDTKWGECYDSYAAPSTLELAKMLAPYVDMIAPYFHGVGQEQWLREYNPNTLAEILCWCIEKGIIKVEELKV